MYRTAAGTQSAHTGNARIHELCSWLNTMTATVKLLAKACSPHIENPYKTLHTSSQTMLFTFQIKILPIRIKNNERTKQNKILATCDLVPFYGFSKHMKSFKYSTRFWLSIIWSLWTTIIYANCCVHFDCRIFVFLFCCCDSVISFEGFCLSDGFSKEFCTLGYDAN